MAAGAFTMYSNGVLNITKGLINLSADTFVVTLLTNSYTPNADTNTSWLDVSANELTTANGYTAGGAVLSTLSDTLTTNTVTFTAANPSWPNFSAGPFRYAVIVRRAGGTLATADLLICYCDLTGSGTLTGTGGAYTLSFSASGIFQASHTP